MAGERHRPYVYAVVGIAALFAFAVSVEVMVPKHDVMHDASLNVLPVPTGVDRYPNVDELQMCSPRFSPVLDESSKIKYNVMTPKLLPEGYSLKGVDVVSSNGVEMITLYYWDRPLCDIANNLPGGPVLNGAVVVRVANSLKVPDAHAQMIDTVNKMVPKYDLQQIMINGIPAIGNQPSILNAVDVSEDMFPYPARIFVMTNKMLYNIEANMPLEDLAKIAESIS